MFDSEPFDINKESRNNFSEYSMTPHRIKQILVSCS